MKTREFITRRVPGLLPVLLVVLLQFACYCIPKVLIPDVARIFIDSPLDDAIPFIPAFVVFYLGAFVQWAIYYLHLAAAKPAERYPFLAAEIAAKLIGAVCFVAFPVSMVRPDVVGEGFFLWLMRIVYGVDGPICLFPSFHTMLSMFSTLRVFGDERAGTPAKVGSALFTLGVCASTVLVKQHLFMDAVAGVVLALACYFLVRQTKFVCVTQRLFESINAKVLGIHEEDR